MKPYTNTDPARKTLSDAGRTPITKLSCTCPGCRAHVARLEELNAQLSQEVDRLRAQLDGRRAA